MLQKPLTTYSFTQKLLTFVVLVILLGWLIDRAILVRELDERIAKRSLSSRPEYLLDNTFMYEDSQLLQQKSEFHVVYKILKCWRHWTEANDGRSLGFAATALGMLDCRTFEDFQERHLVISKHVELKFTDSELISLDQFIKAALNHEQ